jgi:hypothetical protein
MDESQFKPKPGIRSPKQSRDAGTMMLWSEFKLDSAVRLCDNHSIIPSGSSLFRWFRVPRDAAFVSGGVPWLE